MVVRLDVDELTQRRIDEVAKARGITTEEVIRKALEQYLSGQAGGGRGSNEPRPWVW